MATNRSWAALGKAHLDFKVFSNPLMVYSTYLKDVYLRLKEKQFRAFLWVVKRLVSTGAELIETLKLFTFARIMRVKPLSHNH